jgi:hypothetical protein
LGLFEKNIPANNKAALFNYFIIVVMAGLSYYFFTVATSKDATNIPQNLELFYNEKMKYTIILCLICIFHLEGFSANNWQKADSLFNAENFVDSVNNNDNSYYVFLGLSNPTKSNSFGRSTGWNSNPDEPVDNLQYVSHYKDTLLFGKKITLS